MATATEILDAKKAAGTDSYLWVHTSGDVILWPSEEVSQGDDGYHAIGRWQVSPDVLAALIDSGEADELA